MPWWCWIPIGWFLCSLAVWVLRAVGARAAQTQALVAEHVPTLRLVEYKEAEG